MSAPEQRRLAAIMFTDMVGYSALSQRDEALALQLLEEHRRLVREIVARNGGREVKSIGDGFLFEFPSALSAVRAAVEIQQVFHERNQSCGQERQIRIRIGIHVGDVVLSDGDIHGDGVNIAARIEPLAAPGGICVSEDVLRTTRNKLSYPLAPLGPTELKNIDLPVEIFRVMLPWESEASPPALVAASPTQPPAATQKSVAVLAFADLSPDKNNEYFSDGISEELLNVLARIPGLKVTARTSAFSFKGKQVPIAEIARQLGVAYVVEGSVRTAGKRLRITAQLINAADGFHVWSENFDRDASDIFAVQDEIAGLIAQNLQMKMAVAGDRPVANPDAHRLLLQGRFFAQRLNAAGWRQAIDYFRQAIALAPNYALAWAEMARCYVLMARYEGISSTEGFLQARVAAERALALDPGLPQGLDALGWVQRTADWNWAGAERSFRTALSSEPQNAGILGDLAVVIGNQGRIDEAIALARRATELDPLSAEALNYLSIMLWSKPGHFAEGVRCMRKAIELAPGAAEYHALLCFFQLGHGNVAEAAESAEREPSEHHRLSVRALVETSRNNRETAQANLDELILRYADKVPFLIAIQFAAMRRHDDAFAWLDRAYAQGDAAIAWIKHVPQVVALHHDVRWTALMRKMNLNEEH